MGPKYDKPETTSFNLWYCGKIFSSIFSYGNDNVKKFAIVLGGSGFSMFCDIFSEDFNN